MGVFIPVGNKSNYLSLTGFLKWNMPSFDRLIPKMEHKLRQSNLGKMDGIVAMFADVVTITISEKSSDKLADNAKNIIEDFSSW